MPESVAVIGAGLVGCFAAVALARRDYNVTLFDYRQDPRSTTTSDRNLRSINLAISARGITALEFIDKAMSERVLKDVIPMKGRMIHDIQGRQEAQNYGLFGECINSIDRAVLSNFLLDELESYPNIKVVFGHKLARITFGDAEQVCEFIPVTESGASRDSDAQNGAETRKRFSFDFVVGSDGAYSTTRSQMQRVMRMDYAQEYIDCCYIELYIPPAKETTEFGGKFSISPNHLHIWPRHNYMLIALANEDGSFTSTFFGPWALVESLKSTSKIEQFFTENFPDAVNLIGLEKAVYAFENHPKGALMCVECKPYHVSNGRAIIIGDAAHSMVPFYGQGMNCGFEDVKVLMQILDKNSGDRSVSFEEYSTKRHEDLVAIIKLAKDNYKEMSHKVTSKWFLLRKKLDTILGKTLKGRWLPLYTMVSFRADIPYHKAIEVESRQKRILVYLQAIVIAATSLGGYGAFKLLRKTLKRCQ